MIMPKDDDRKVDGAFVYEVDDDGADEGMPEVDDLVVDGDWIRLERKLLIGGDVVGNELYATEEVHVMFGDALEGDPIPEPTVVMRTTISAIKKGTDQETVFMTVNGVIVNDPVKPDMYDVTVSCEKGDAWELVNPKTEPAMKNFVRIAMTRMASRFLRGLGQKVNEEDLDESSGGV